MADAPHGGKWPYMCTRVLAAQVEHLTGTRRTSENSVKRKFREIPECELRMYAVLRSSLVSVSL